MDKTNIKMTGQEKVFFNPITNKSPQGTPANQKERQEGELPGGLMVRILGFPCPLYTILRTHKTERSPKQC